MSNDAKDFLAIAIYVDDFITITNNTPLRESIMKRMEKKFKVVSLGHAKWILGVKIEKTPQGIQLSQEKYAQDIITKFGMKNAKPVITPVVPDNARTAKSSTKPVDKKEYMSMVGSLIYLAVITRPDIAFAVSKVGQAMADPKPEDVVAVKRIMCYIIKEPALSLHYQRRTGVTLIGYSDSDWAGDTETRKSTMGYVFTLAGAAISWNSRKQQTVVLSTAEAKYMAVAATTQEAIHLRALLEELGFKQKKPTLIYQDNQSSIAIAHNDTSNRRTKHIDIRYHFVRERILTREIRIEYLPTESMIADCLTKAVGKQVLDRAKGKIFGPQIHGKTTGSEGEC